MALRIGQVVPVAELVDAIWEAEPPRSARASLQALMTRLRQLLKPLPDAVLTRVGDGYLLEFDQDLIDAERSRALGRAARAADGDIYSAIGNKAMAKAVWRRALAILEELQDLGADEVRSRLGVAPGPAVSSTY